MTARVRRRTTCRLCLHEGLQTVLELAPTPPGDAFVSAGERGAQEAFPLDLALCTHCGNAQLWDVVDPDLLYRDYLYVTTSSPGSARPMRTVPSPNTLMRMDGVFPLVR